MHRLPCPALATRAFVAFVITLACLATTTGRADPAAGTPIANPYRIQAGDVLAISVWNEPELKRDVLVRSDGALSYPLAGDIPASGMSIEELRQLIEVRLAKYIPQAVVTVALNSSGGNRIYVLGKVNRPGEYPFGKPLDVMQAISLAGGLTPFAAPNDILILRRGPGGRQESIPFRYSEVVQGERLSQNVLLSGGDTVVVP